MAKRRSAKTKKVANAEREWNRRLYDWKRGLMRRGGSVPVELTVEWAREQDRCPYCHIQLTYENAGLDHKSPYSLGGDNRIFNLHVVCMSCNRAKGSLTDAQFRALHHLIENPPFDERAQKMVLRKLKMAWRVT